MPLEKSAIRLFPIKTCTLFEATCREYKKTSTVPIGYSDLGYSGRAGYSDLNPRDGGQSLYPMCTLYIYKPVTRAERENWLESLT